MKLIQCYNTTLAGNIPGCLYATPEEIILLGYGDEVAQAAQRYRDFLQGRRLNTKVTEQDLSNADLSDISAGLTRLVRSGADYAIDLTGGSELLVMAVGCLMAGLCQQERCRLQVWKFDPITGSGIHCVDGTPLPRTAMALSVGEVIALHGGTVHPSSEQPDAKHRSRELNGLWQLLCDSAKDWNQNITLLDEFESRADSRTQVYLPLRQIRGSIRNFEEKEPQVRNFVEQLGNSGVIRNESSRHALEYTYDSPLLRHCTRKAGNLLEVKTLLEARELEDGGRKVFHDCQMGVNIDWDGVIHDKAAKVPETRNEIDLVLMNGLTPLFISCKNGDIPEGELYKLHTVASRFGGPYAKKMLIATDLDRKSAAGDRAFIQRAWDMDIYLVTDASLLSQDEWKQTFLTALL